APHGLSSLVQAFQGGTPLDMWLPVFTEEHWLAATRPLLAWSAAIGAGAAVAALASGWKISRGPVAFVTIGLVAGGAAASALFDGRVARNRPEVAIRDRLALLEAYDARDVRPVDATHFRRLSEPEFFETTKLTVNRGEVTDLPEGEYEARVWF